MTTAMMHICQKSLRIHLTNIKLMSQIYRCSKMRAHNPGTDKLDMLSVKMISNELNQDLVQYRMKIITMYHTSAIS